MITLEDSKGLRGTGKPSCQEWEGRAEHFRGKATQQDVLVGEVRLVQVTPTMLYYFSSPLGEAVLLNLVHYSRVLPS